MSDTDKPNKLENDGLVRDEKGRVVSGVLNPLGRPKRKTLTELIHERLDQEPEGWKDLVEIILSMAKRKDKEIIKELWHYTDGMPKQRTDVDITSGGEPLVVIKDGSKTESVADKSVE